MPLGLCAQCLLRLGLGAHDAGWDAGEAEAPQRAFASSEMGLESPCFGDYQLLEEVGRGGMGIVYKARQQSLGRLVALKTILFGPLASPEQVRRFRSEASAAAALQHPNIVAVHEVGEHQHHHYLAMDLVDGPNLGSLVANKPLPARQAALYLRSVAEAIHFAHEHGILHRDLKPSNVLIGSDDRPRVADFGLACQLGTDSSLTMSGQMLGSPNYMPPEQIGGKAERVGRAADVYGLGAILYHLLTGRPPFQAETIPETLRLVALVDPLSPRALVPSVPEDLETICLKCLEKEPTKRYETALGVAEDLERFLRDEPIQARPVGALGKAWRWSRRKPAVAAALLVSLGSLIAITVISSVSSVRTDRAREAERLEAYYSAIALADQFLQQGNTQGAKDILFGCPAEFRHWEWGHLMYLCHQEVISIAAHTNAVPFNPEGALSAVFSSAASRISEIHFTPDGTGIVSRGIDGSVKVWNVEDGRMRFGIVGDLDTPATIAIDSTGRRLALGFSNGWTRVYEMADGREIGSIRHGSNTVSCVGFAMGGRLVTKAERGWVRVWDVDTGECLRQWLVPEGESDPRWLSKKGDRMVIQQRNGATVWDTDSGSQLWELNTPSESHVACCFAENARSMVTFDAENRAKLRRFDGTSAELGLIRGAGWNMYRWVTWSSDCRLFCTGGEFGSAHVWDHDTGESLFSLEGRTTAARFSPDGTLLATVGVENFVRIWEVATGREIRRLRGHAVVVEHLSFSPDGRLIATGDQDGTIKIWSTRRGREVLPADSWVHSPRYTADGKRVASSALPLDVTVWDAESGSEELRLGPGPGNNSYTMEFSPDGRYLATGGSPVSLVQLWDAKTGEKIRTFAGHTRYVLSVAFSPNGKQLASGSWDGTVRLWDVESGAMQRILTSTTGTVNQVLYSPDSERVYGWVAHDQILSWDTRSGRLLFGIKVPYPIYPGFALTPDGLRIYASDLVEKKMRAWDAQTGQALTRVPLPPRPGCMISFAPDGQRMAMVILDSKLSNAGQTLGVVVDVLHGREVLSLHGHTQPWSAVQFDSAGRRIVSTSVDTTTRQWESFPWREQDYAGLASGTDFRGRVRTYADDYWRKRLRAESKATLLPPRRLPIRWDRSFWPKRDNQAGPCQIDLTEHYTGRLDTCPYPLCSLDATEDHLGEFAPGSVTLNHILFDVRGLVTLRLLNTQGNPWRLLWEQYPTKAEGIPVHQRLRKLHVLHAVEEWLGAEDQTKVGSYILRYADGTQAELPIVVGRHVLPWRVDCREGATPETLPEGTEVWTGSNPCAKGKNQRVRLFLSSYVNPLPNKTVATVDFVSAMAANAPFLVAMTVEP